MIVHVAWHFHQHCAYVHKAADAAAAAAAAAAAQGGLLVPDMV